MVVFILFKKIFSEQRYKFFGDFHCSLVEEKAFFEKVVLSTNFNEGNWGICGEFITFATVKNSLTRRRLAASLLSVVLLAPGWLGFSGLTLLGGFVPLLWISDSYDGSRRAWWRMFGWALLTFSLWSASCDWWIGFATPIGPPAAIFFSTIWMMIPFMLYHSVSKKAPKSLAYVLLIAGWIACEHHYQSVEISWPWLLLGNGFSHDVRLVQWYEYTGIFGGSLWVWCCNLMLFEAFKRGGKKRWAGFVALVILPMLLSLGIYATYENPTETTRVSALQPNVDCYDKFSTGDDWQEQNLLQLLEEVPADADFILAPETALTRYMDEAHLNSYPHLVPFRQALKKHAPEALLISGANTMRYYAPGNQTHTARYRGGRWYDHYNTALAIDTTGVQALYHKGKLVIGVENTPRWFFDLMDFLVVDLGGIVGQIGIGERRICFSAPSGVKGGPAICYEGIFGDFFGDFVRQGAEVMFLISNDGWWGDTPGYKHLFSFSRLRAIEHRRAIGRSANTGQSGFIDCRGDVVGQNLGWEERGVITHNLPLNHEITLYTRYGDYIARIAKLLTLLSILYYIAYRVRRRNHLVE